MKNFYKKIALVVFALATMSVSFAQVITPHLVYVNDRGNNAINRYELDGTLYDIFITSGSGGLNNPQDIVFHPDGTMLVTGFLNNQILQYNGETGAFIGVWNQSPLVRPSRMSIGPDGLIYVTQWGATTVVKFNLDGTLAGNSFGASALNGLGLTWDSVDNLYVAIWNNAGNGVVQKYDSSCVYQEDFIDTTNLLAPTYIWFEDGSGDMLVQDWFGNSVLRYSSSGEYLGVFISGIIRPEGYAYLPNGNLLISERVGNKITEFTADGTLIGQWNQGAQLSTPNSIRVKLNPALSVSEYELNTVFVTPSIGSKFNLNEEISSDYESLSVYNSIGQLIAEINPKNTNVLDTTNYTEGLYFIIALSKEGKFSQKIIVKK